MHEEDKDEDEEGGRTSEWRRKRYYMEFWGSANGREQEGNEAIARFGSAREFLDRSLPSRICLNREAKEFSIISLSSFSTTI